MSGLIRFQNPMIISGFRFRVIHHVILVFLHQRLHELQLFLVDDDLTRDGYTTIIAGPSHPDHAQFAPGPGVGLGYDDLKTIEAHNFLQSIVSGTQGEPGFGEALVVARVLAAVMRSWESERWEMVGLAIDN